ncbi:MAG: cysteine desulfurase [Oscillospiraceae bacterium]|nr:cysteine desulfurase [Oscillospiraceae bacterium]
MAIYLDNAATTQVCPEAAQAALQAMTEAYANPSSTHRMGREAAKILESSRTALAKALGCDTKEVYFTSCGSESDNWAIIKGAKYNRRAGKHIISSAAEHSAVLRSLDYLKNEGYEITLLKPEASGSISPEAVKEALREDTCLVTLMMVNNETGAVTDISAVKKVLKAASSRALLHTDAVQGFMKVPFSAKTLGADMISISGHKLHAPKGIGALYIRSGLNIESYILGGKQENSRRAGTESIPLIAALGAAAQLAHKNLKANCAHLAQLRSHAVNRLTEENPGLIVIGGGADHILSLSLPGYRSEVIMNYLESKEIFVSRSSACKKGGRSHVLEAMGVKSDVIDGAIRVSFSHSTTLEDIDTFCDELKSARENLRAAVR